MAETVEAFGGLDILVNNAGIIKLGRLADFAEAEWDRIFAVNVKGAFLLAQAAVPHLEQRGGLIINIASNAGNEGPPSTAPTAPLNSRLSA